MIVDRQLLKRRKTNFSDEGKMDKKTFSYQILFTELIYLILKVNYLIIHISNTYNFDSNFKMAIVA